MICAGRRGDNLWEGDQIAPSEPPAASCGREEGVCGVDWGSRFERMNVVG